MMWEVSPITVPRTLWGSCFLDVGRTHRPEQRTRLCSKAGTALYMGGFQNYGPFWGP